SSGNVGIGTTMPSEKLHIRGDGSVLKFTNDAGADRTDLSIDGGNSLAGTNDTVLYNYYGNIYLSPHSYGAATIFTGSGGGASADKEVMRVSGTGKVGIGVTSPTAYLHLAPVQTTANTAPIK